MNRNIPQFAYYENQNYIDGNQDYEVLNNNSSYTVLQPAAFQNINQANQMSQRSYTPFEQSRSLQPQRAMLYRHHLPMSHQINQLDMNHTSQTDMSTTTSSITIDPNVNNMANKMKIKDLRYAITHDLPPFIVKYDNEGNIDRRDLPSAMNAKLFIENHLRRQGVSFNGFALTRPVGKRLKLYVSNRDDYHKLMTTDEWPDICGSTHLKISVIKPSVIPSQFSLVIRNVPASISINKIQEDVNCSISSATNFRKLISKYGKKSIDYRFEVPDLNEYKAAVSQGVIGQMIVMSQYSNVKFV
ncbi:unnamed protein product [Didymodactylos carnosus]|uniref:Uncharacterized protein n=1 Tax=Didymodactylos carnosus TaxID=1234261 RepID=A0A815IH48_9BILA|nr:unnamed protein product [Didymodactylos carnosus]CAF4248065.1 unnamed protein product [Didymodactylos carnosus]